MRAGVMRVGVTAAVAVVMCVFAACGDDEGSSGGGGGSADKPSVYVLLPSLESSSYVRERAGAAAAAKSVDADVTVDAGTSRGEATNMVSKLETAMSKGYDAIAVNPGAVGNEISPVLARAREQGTKILTFDQTVPDFEGLTSFIQYNGELSGKQMGEFMVDALPDGGKTGVIDCFSENPLTKSINDGIEAAIEGSGVSIVQRVDAKCDPAMSRTAAEDLLVAHPDLKGIFGITDIGAMGASRVVDKKGKDFILIGGGAETEVLKMMESGSDVIDATTTFPFERFGRQTVETAVAAVEGKKVPKSVIIDSELVTPKNASEVRAELKAEGES